MQKVIMEKLSSPEVLNCEAQLSFSKRTRGLCDKKTQIGLKQQVGYLRAAVWYVST